MDTSLVQKCTYNGNTVTLLLNVPGRKGEERKFTKQELKEFIELLRAQNLAQRASLLEREVLEKWPTSPQCKKGYIDYPKHTA